MIYSVYYIRTSWYDRIGNNVTFWFYNTPIGTLDCVCVCFFPFILDIKLDVPAGVTQEEGHTGFLIHLLSVVRALIFQGFTWTAKISTGRDGGKIDGWPTFFISAGARDWQNIGVEILGGTGRDGIFLGKILSGTGRLFLFFEAGRGGCFFSEAGRGGRFFSPKRDGAVVFFFRGGTGRLYFFSEAGRGGCIFFSRRDGTGWLCFFSAGTGRLYFLFVPGRVFFFSAGTGRLTVVVFSAGTVLVIRVPSGGG